ncbi:hypothetical protein [Candidatus Foliamicus sp.]
MKGLRIMPSNRRITTARLGIVLYRRASVLCALARHALRKTAPLAAAALCVGCSDAPPPPPLPVALTVEIAAAGDIDTTATVHLSVHHAWSGVGELRYPLEIIDRRATQLGASNFSFGYPTDKGEGLLVYAWIDTDGDGIHCTPTSRGDLANLVEIAEFPSQQVSASLILETPCAGPDWFFPGPEPAMPDPAGPEPTESQPPTPEPASPSS